MLQILVVFYLKFRLKFACNRIYQVPATQGLKKSIPVFLFFDMVVNN